MKENKKINAFTLMELLASIAIIGIITLLATITYGKIRKDMLEKQYINLELLIESAANKYAAKYGYYSFFVQELIDEGYLETDDENNIYDPRDKSILNCHLVNVTEDENGIFKSKLQKEDHRENGTCKTSDRDVYASALQIAAKLHDTNISYPQNGPVYVNNSDPYPSIINGWTNKQLDLTGVTSNITDDLTNAKLIWNSDQGQTTIYPTVTHTTNIVKFYKDYYYLDLYTRENKHYQARLMYKYDNEPPVVYVEKTKVIDNEVWQRTGKTVVIYATDKDGVGLSKIYVGERPCTDMLTDPSLGRATIPGVIHTYYIDEDLDVDGKNFNVCVTDKLGNLTNGGTVNIKKIDKTPPVVYEEQITVSADDEWTNYDKTVTVTGTDFRGVGIDRMYVGDRPCSDLLLDRSMGKAPDANNTQTFEIGDELDATGRDYNVCIIDKLDNLGATYTVRVKKIDKTNPTPTFDYSPHDNLIAVGQPRYYDPVTVTFTCSDDNSGVASVGVTNALESGDIPLSWTPAVGHHIVTESCTDNAGNTASTDWEYMIVSRSSSGGGGGSGGSGGGGGGSSSGRCYVNGRCTVCSFTGYRSQNCSKFYDPDEDIIKLPGGGTAPSTESVSGACIEISYSFQSITFGCAQTETTTHKWKNNVIDIVGSASDWVSYNCTGSDGYYGSCRNSTYYYRYTVGSQSSVTRLYPTTKVKCNTLNTFAQTQQGGAQETNWKCQ